MVWLSFPTEGARPLLAAEASSTGTSEQAAGGGCSRTKPACWVPGFEQKHLSALHMGLAVVGVRYWCALLGLGL